MKKTILSILATGLLAGCASILDKESYTDHEAEILKTSEGMYALLNGIYDICSGPNYYGRHMYAYEACKGVDFFVRISSGNSYERECRYAESATASGYAARSWLTIYSAIRTATNLIETVDESALEPEEARRARGEATALRALAYFDLMRMFAYPPRFSVPGGEEYHDRYKWGVPIIRDMETVDNIYKYEIRRETAADTYKYIENEFLEAQRLLEDTESDRGHINYVAVCALLTRLYLYEERWPDVIEQGELALSAAAGRYSALDYDSYRTNYYQPFNSENIWELVYSLTDNNGANDLNYLVRCPTWEDPGAEKDGQVSQTVGYAAYGMQNSAITLLNQKVGDVKDVRAYLICELGFNNYKGCRKYVGNPYHYVHNIPIVRLPEIWLSLAEAYLHKEDRSSAERYYKMLRRARICDDSGFTSEQTEKCLAEVLAERRRELILEGHTYWDYFRRGETMVRTQATIENLNKRTIAFGYDSGKSNARAQVIYPIPLAELEANRAIRDQQNPGYDSYDDVYLNN